MNIFKKYSIPYKGLSIGSHEFKFKVGDAFFDSYDNLEIKGGDVDVDVMVNRQANLLSLEFEMKGTVRVECDRCLDDVSLPVEYEGVLSVRFSETEQDSDGEVMWISPMETEIPLAQYIYDSIVLSLPYQRIHPDDSNGHSTCDPDMLGRFMASDEASEE